MVKLCKSVVSRGNETTPLSYYHNIILVCTLFFCSYSLLINNDVHICPFDFVSKLVQMFKHLYSMTMSLDLHDGS